MDIRWQSDIHIAAPYDFVYRYLADFPRHAEWAQTIDWLELVKEGSSSGEGAHFRTYERQGMQAHRGPREPLRVGTRMVSLCEVVELSPCYRIAWRARLLERSGMSSELSFDITTDELGGTRLLQRIALHSTRSFDMLDRLRNRTDPVIYSAQLRAQWEAGLRNIKEIIEADFRAEQFDRPSEDVVELRSLER